MSEYGHLVECLKFNWDFNIYIMWENGAMNLVRLSKINVILHVIVWDSLLSIDAIKDHPFSSNIVCTFDIYFGKY